MWDTKEDLHILANNYFVDTSGVGQLSKTYYRVRKDDFFLKQRFNMGAEDYGFVYTAFKDDDDGLFLARYGGERTGERALKVGLMDAAGL